MNLYILGNNLIIFFTVVFTSLCYLYLYKSYRKKLNKIINLKARRKFKKRSLIILAITSVVALVISFFLLIISSRTFDSVLPSSMILDYFPLGLGISLIALSIYNKSFYLPLTLIIAIIGFLFTLIIINDYYRYYPLLGEVFGATNATTQKNSITVSFKINNTNSKNSVQYSLTSLNSKDTAGSLYQINIPGTISKFKARTGYVYIPAAYNEISQINFPVIILLAGFPGSPSDWVNAGINNIMDKFAAQHLGITPLIFVIDDDGQFYNDTECVDSSRGNVETYLTQDVPNYIKANYRADTSPSNWAIGGISMGGMCSIMLTLLHPNVYNTFIDMAGEIGPEIGNKQTTVAKLFNGNQQAWQDHQPTYLLSTKKFNNISGYFGSGAQDNLYVLNDINSLYSQTRSDGLDTVKEIINGQHSFNVWKESYTDSLEFISNRIGATECSSASCF